MAVIQETGIGALVIATVKDGLQVEHHIGVRISQGDTNTG
jgi:hypothetical protein